MEPFIANAENVPHQMITISLCYVLNTFASPINLAIVSCHGFLTFERKRV